MERLHIREVLVVEGKHDAIRLSPLTDATIFATDGFRSSEIPNGSRCFARWRRNAGSSC